MISIDLISEKSHAQLLKTLENLTNKKKLLIQKSASNDKPEEENYAGEKKAIPENFQNHPPPQEENFMNSDIEDEENYPDRIENYDHSDGYDGEEFTNVLMVGEMEK